MLLLLLSDQTLGAIITAYYLLAENGDNLITESGDKIITE